MKKLITAAALVVLAACSHVQPKPAVESWQTWVDEHETVTNVDLPTQAFDGWFDITTYTVNLNNPFFSQETSEEQAFTVAHEEAHGLSVWLGFDIGPVTNYIDWSTNIERPIAAQWEAQADCLAMIHLGYYTDEIRDPAAGYGPCTPELEHQLRLALAAHGVEP